MRLRLIDPHKQKYKNFKIAGSLESIVQKSWALPPSFLCILLGK